MCSCRTPLDPACRLCRKGVTGVVNHYQQRVYCILSGATGMPVHQSVLPPAAAVSCCCRTAPAAGGHLQAGAGEQLACREAESNVFSGGIPGMLQLACLLYARKGGGAWLGEAVRGGGPPWRRPCCQPVVVCTGHADSLTGMQNSILNSTHHAALSIVAQHWFTGNSSACRRLPLPAPACQCQAGTRSRC